MEKTGDLEARYSRQSYSIGKQSTLKLSLSKVLVVGNDIVGEEVIKNCILMGFGTVNICDNKDDNFENKYFDKDSLLEYRLLNPNVNVDFVNIKDENDILKTELFDNYDLYVIVNSVYEEAFIFNEIVRRFNKKIIITGHNGLIGYIFNDFGEEFVINDQDGEDYKELIIESITGNEIVFKDKHKLCVNDIIEIKYTNGETNNIKVIGVETPLKVKLDEKVLICQNIDDYSLIIKKKIPLTVNHNTFRNLIEKNDYEKIAMCDFSVPFDRNELLFDLGKALNEYYVKFNDYPRPWNNNDFEIFFSIFLESLNLTKDDLMTNTSDKISLINDNLLLIKKYCFTSNGSFKPLASVIGGIVSHEAIKAITKKFIPLNQVFQIDLLNDLISDKDIEDVDDIEKFKEDIFKSVTNCKYNNLINIFGYNFVNKMQNIHPFIIGSGAIGCELLKNLSCLGIKNISLTDNDSIEKSNLSRQLLFDDNSIGKSKSVSAGNKIMSKNSDINVYVYESRVEANTENIFDDKFHKNIDVYLNALDNVAARRYMDTMSIKYEKPSIDSGTTGAQASVGIVVPYLTESYNSQKNDASEEQIPLCTLKSLPFRTEHTIQWSRELFEEEFKIIPGLIKKYSENNYENMYKTSCGELSNVCKKLYKYKIFDGSFESIITLSKIMYYENFIKNIKETIETYKNKEGFEGKLPIYIEDSESTNDFINTTIQIYNQVFKTNIKAKIKVCDFINKLHGDCFEGNCCFNFDTYYNKEIEEMIDNYDKTEICEELKNILSRFENKYIDEVDFEKDDDNLHHIDWITISSNMRNYQYFIKQTDKFQVRIIAGKIIPAMITTTSVVAGYQLIEFVKLVKLYEKGKYEFGDIDKDIEKYRNKYINLNMNYHIGNEPSECPKYKLIEIDNNKSLSVNLWTRFVSESNKTEDIVNVINTKLDNSLTIYSITEVNDEGKYIYDDYEVVEELTLSKYCKVEFDEFEEHNTTLLVYILKNDV